MKQKLSNPLKKIVMIGPVYPYKGGISHYTGLMNRSLSEKYETVMISYKMQYPKFLFKKEQRDYENDSFKIENTQYLINTANPFNLVSTARKIRKMKPDVVIFQWWHPYFSPCYWIMEKCLHGIKKMFVCHNVFPHERFPLDKFLAKMVLKSGDCFITHSAKDAKDLLTIKKTENVVQAVHPTYNAFKFEDLTAEEARKRLNIKEEEHVLLFFGFVREYKGLKHLLRAMPELKKADPKIKLLVVGDFGEDEPEYMDLISKLDIKDVLAIYKGYIPDKEVEQYFAASDLVVLPYESADEPEYMDLISKLDIKDVLAIYKGYIPDKEVEQYFAASDLVVLPYESATQSGVVQMAYGFGKPVLVTEVGGLPDVVTDQKTGYVVTPKCPGEIAEKVQEFFAKHRAEEFSEHIKAEEYKFSWDRMREHVETLYEKANR